MPQDRIDSLLDAMTVDEQITLLAGRDFWTTEPIERLGVPAIKVSDGPNGARGGGAFVGGVTAAAFPVSISLGASWNIGLVREVGAALAEEAKSKGARVLLAPTVNLHRSTLNGRNFECYSEDPFLTSELAVAYIQGLQGAGVGATIKHFIGNESEYQRATISSDIDERTLREIYMPPFEAAVKRAQTFAVMTSYNRLDGTYVSERADIVRDILKGEWGFDGLVMSDWFGTKSTAEAVAGGLDLEMPGPPRFRGGKLREAVEAGLVDKAHLREAARRVLRLIERVGAFERPEIEAERAEDLPQTRALIRRAGADGMVLLANNGALPLQPAKGETLAVIGPNAKQARAMGGGSAQLNPHYLITPLDALRAALPQDVRLSYELGCDNRRLAATMSGRFEAEFFDGVDFAGPVKASVTSQDGLFMYLGETMPNVSATSFSARIRTRQTVAATGDYELSLIASGPSRLYLDGELLIDNWDFAYGEEFFSTCNNEALATRRLEAGKAYEILAEWRAVERPEGLGLTVLRLGLSPVVGAQAIASAVALAREADAALLFVGLNGEWDGEGLDRPHLSLPRGQNELIEQVAAVNRKTIVVLQSGCPVLMPWLDKVAAVLQAWYPGQEVGHAIADVLLGAAEPGGRLPQSFPRRMEDDPAFLNYPGEAGHVRYGEGLFIGYRYYEKRKVAPLFPFGFGLSYTRFAAGELALDHAELAPGESLTATLDITNTGARAGSTVVQVYVADEKAGVVRPEQELKGFAKVWLAPGQTERVSVILDMRALAFFDVSRKAWVAEAGRFTLRAGFSSADIVASAPFVLTRSWIDESPRRAMAANR